MKYQTALIIGVILMAQVNIIQSIKLSHICYDCSDFLNSAQCIVEPSRSMNAPGLCMFTNGICTDPPILNLSSTMNVSMNLRMKNSTLPNISTQPTCAEKSDTSCQGKDGQSLTSKCALTEDNVCVGIDTTQSCSTFTNQTFCDGGYFCQWNQIINEIDTNSSTGTCTLITCADRIKKSTCFFAFGSSSLSASIPCKWTQNEQVISTGSLTTINTVGRCSTGLATDIPLKLCSQKNPFFTYSTVEGRCIQCQGTYTLGSSIIQSIVMCLLTVLLSW